MDKNITGKKAKYYLNAAGEFVIENYNFARPFANFFPGIAGKYGIPMWTFYVNRGQGISSFGTKDKDHAILEFFPANKSWQCVSSLGFRTFIKIKEDKKTLLYEPFHNGFSNLRIKLQNRMRITSSYLTLEEENASSNLGVKIEYFNIPNDSYAGLARIVTLKNLGRKKISLGLLDGLPQIVPYGTSNMFLKKLGRTIEAWMNVENLDRAIPFYKLDVDPTDRPEVIPIREGNFYLGFHFSGKKAKIIRPIVDPQYIFGPVTDFSLPLNFIGPGTFRYPEKQLIKSRTPCAFLHLNLELAPSQEKAFYCLIGQMRSLEALNKSVAKITSCGYLAQKQKENKEVIAQLEQNIATSSSCREFDLYARQTYLDNVIRGGYPLTFKSGKVFYLYSRKHGDLERDYNKFLIQPTYFSQGNGNYRDMNQNRRLDTWFNPDIKHANLNLFLNLLQADGFNPLVIKGESFALGEGFDLKSALKNSLEPKEIQELSLFLKKPFTPGELIFFLEEKKIKPIGSRDELLEIVVANSETVQEAEHAEGFWTDHWAYNLDLLESYLGVYPEELRELLFKEKEFTFYDNTEVVRPRQEKYLLKEGAVRQFHAVAHDAAKKEIIRKRAGYPHLVRNNYGKGEILKTTLINKLLCLLANKLASLDPFGIGIEMEADKPNWFDALNGLPGLLGSSLCETLELKRLVVFIQEALEKAGPKNINVGEEIDDFLLGLDRLIKENLSTGTAEKDYQYWDKSSSLKEDYRRKTRFGFSGKEISVGTQDLMLILKSALAKINLSIAKARDKKRGVYCGYFINEVTEYELLKAPFVKPKKFIQKRLPLFLEPQMHALRIAADKKEIEALYKGTRASPLFDKKLKMYKVTASLAAMPQEIGRCRAFTPGWLENESIWLHMEYKYLLELLKQGLYAEFYRDFKNALIPFQPAERYGRSILENSSFLVSSAFPDKNLHGNGFVARLSGSTAEFLEIWLTMNLGLKPFFLNAQNALNLKFSPILAGWLFDKKGLYSFNFLSRVSVVYHNPKRKDTFGSNAVKVKKITFKDKDANPVEISSDTIPSPYALQIRSRQVMRIDVYFA